MKTLRLLVLAAGLISLWQLLVSLSGVPHYILPDPLRVLVAIGKHWTTLLRHLGTTFSEILLGFVLGILMGSATALTMFLAPVMKRWLLPILVISQAIPVFALAPILVLWFGYGMASKVAMAVLIIYFPVTSSLFYGMQRTQPDLLELARIMGGSTLAILRHIVLPSALPAFASGVRVATAVAPIGAVVGEWVGSSSGLGFYMLHANARMQIDLMFAALAVLSLVSLLFYFLVDHLLDKLIFWESKQGII
ncbi:ABC transporter permease [Desulfogranum mediterraneum]|uniref:ABC transporter permease n=1 Tax=Desulfogranum mediterraneum TaxID=160661 RepID=UPI000423A4EE|nr:ABC transporter permease [Desulfogranum mediterraneum]